MYIVFGGDEHYASGGWNDFLYSCEDENEAVNMAKAILGKYAVTSEPLFDWDDDMGHDIDWTHVINAATKECVYKSDNSPYGGDIRTLFVKDTVTNKVFLDARIKP